VAGAAEAAADTGRETTEAGATFAGGGEMRRPYPQSPSIQVKLKSGAYIHINPLARKEQVIVDQVLVFKLRLLGTDSLIKHHLQKLVRLGYNHST
jgi:hypothetical protein